jgi:hypothetical protein
MNAIAFPAFEAPMSPVAVAIAIRCRRVDRNLWNTLRAGRQRAWIVLHDCEDRAARTFVNALGLQPDRRASIERLRASRLAALRRALAAPHPASRAMELATYRALRQSTAAYLAGP